jgi:hypothetical protein
MIIFVYGYYQRSMANKSKSWSTIEGTIIFSRVMEHKDSENNISYKPSIKYKYKVDGTIYRSDRIFFGDMMEQTSSELSMSYVKKFPENTKVVAYYNPYNPKESVLIPGDTRYAGRTMIFSAASLIIGIFLLIHCFWQERQAELNKI